MAIIGLLSYAISDTVNNLKESLTLKGHHAIKLRRMGMSRFRGREGGFLLNYGSSSVPNITIGGATVINPPSRVALSSNKLNSLHVMNHLGVRTVEYTNQQSTAQRWVDGGGLVYVRRTLNGHSGEGIELVYNGQVDMGLLSGNIPLNTSVPSAPLYTKGIFGNRREYRVHVFKNKIIHVAQKRRRNGFSDIPEYNNLVRNHHTGWIYSTHNTAELNIAGKCEALKAVEALGLDFGAVDIITNRDDAWVLEVNTAPGMEGVTLEKYTDAISRFVNGEEVIGETIHDFENFRQGNNNTQENTIDPVTTTQPVSIQQETPPTSGTSSQNTTLVDNGYYWLMINGEQTIGKFYSGVNSFEIIGWEIPVDYDDAIVGNRIIQ